jgi:hypothetical protein
MAASPFETFDTRRPFTRADAVAAGVDPKILRRSLFRRIFRGVYVSREVPDSPFVRAEAALVLHPPGAFASHISAARVYGLPVPTHSFEHVTVLRQEDRRKRPEIRAHVAGSAPNVLRHRGVPVSHPFQMFVELSSLLTLVELVVVGDALVKLFDVRADALVQWCRDSTDRHAADALRAALYVRAEVDSPMETRVRMLIVLGGLPEPKVNHKILDEQGRVRRRLDLSYPWLKLVIEYDGRQHIERIENWGGAVVRREEFDDDGWKTLIVTANDVYKTPGATLIRVRRNLVARGCKDVPTRLSDAWRPHFPGRS